MIEALASLLICQLVGEVAVRALALPLPGPVAGLGLMFAALLWRGRRRTDGDAVPPELGRVCDMLLANLSLLFVPAAVGVVQYLGLIGHYAGEIAVAVAVSTTAVLAVTALTFRFVARLATRRGTARPLEADTDADTQGHP